jgi:hypothetical protein
MEDHAIKALEDVARAYADIRDQRQELTSEEVKLKDRARQLMKQHKKTVYRHGGVEIRIVAGEEDVKVKVRKQDDEQPAGDVAISTAAEASE